MAAKTRAHFPLKPECASKTEPTIESCLRRRRKPGARCAPGGRAHDHRGRPCPHRGREWSAWLERVPPYYLSTASKRPETPGRRRSKGSLTAAQMGIFPHVPPKRRHVCEDSNSPEFAAEIAKDFRAFQQAGRFDAPRTALGDRRYSKRIEYALVLPFANDHAVELEPSCCERVAHRHICEIVEEAFPATNRIHH